MKVVIVGAGEVGFHIAEQLVIENKDVILIEKNPERAKYASSHLDCIVVNNDATSIDVLKDAGLEDADAFISATDFDEVNMISCLIVHKEFEVPVTVARVRNIEYSKTRFLEEKFSGIDYIVNPDIEASRAITDVVQHGAVSDIFLFKDSSIQFRDIFVDEDSYYLNKTLKDIKGHLKEDFVISGILRGEEIIIPFGDTVIENGDHIYIVASEKTFNKILSKTGNPKKKLKNVVVVGAGKIGRHVAEHLLKMGRRVRVVDKKYSRCKYVAENMQGALVIHGDISDESLFEDEQLAASDLIVTTTSNEELNILTAIYAKSLGVKRAVALVNKSNYLNMSDRLGIDATVSPKLSSVNAILKFMRKENIKTVYKIFDGKAEVIEFSLNEKSSMTGKKLKDIKLPKGSLIVAVTRNRENYIPDGEFLLKTGDDIVAFSTKASAEALQKAISG